MPYLVDACQPYHGEVGGMNLLVVACASFPHLGQCIPPLVDAYVTYHYEEVDKNLGVGEIGSFHFQAFDTLQMVLSCASYPDGVVGILILEASYGSCHPVISHGLIFLEEDMMILVVSKNSFL